MTLPKTYSGNWSQHGLKAELEEVAGVGERVLVGSRIPGLGASFGRPSGDVAAAGLASSISFGLLAALGFGSFFVAMDAASEGDVPWALLVARLTAVTVFAAGMLLRRAPLAVRGAELPVIALIGVLIVCADSMYAIASTQGLLGVVAVLSSLYRSSPSVWLASTCASGSNGFSRSASPCASAASWPSPACPVAGSPRSTRTRQNHSKLAQRRGRSP